MLPSEVCGYGRLIDIKAGSVDSVERLLQVFLGILIAHIFNDRQLTGKKGRMEPRGSVVGSWFLDLKAMYFPESCG